jgi:hypothetical protein
MRKKITIEVEMHCGEVSESTVEDAIDGIINNIESRSKAIMWDGYSSELHDYLASDPYQGHKAKLVISCEKH